MTCDSDCASPKRTGRPRRSASGWSCALIEAVQVLQQQHQAALDQIATLQQRVADVEARLQQHSLNSSKPPSSDPPMAPPRPPRVPRGRQAGGQKRHPRHERPTPDPDHIESSVTTSHRSVRAARPGSPSASKTPIFPRSSSNGSCRRFGRSSPPTTTTVCCPGCGGLVTAERPAAERSAHARRRP